MNSSRLGWCVCLRSRLSAVGWVLHQNGLAVRYVRCDVCSRLHVVERRYDVSPCAICRRIVTGAHGDFKVCVIVEGEPATLCMGCAIRSPHRRAWLGIEPE